MIKVTLLSHTPNPEKSVATAARLCYSNSSINEVMDNLSEEKTASFVNMLTSIGHESPIEHINFTFGIENVSRSLLAQLTRHRIASYSVQSQRYVKENMFEFVLPPKIENIPQAKEEFIKAMEEDQKHYDNLTDILKEKHKENFIKMGYSEKKAVSLAEKKAIEDARFVLPNACATKLIMTMNARSLINFFSHRCCNRAQWEIKELACKMLKLVFDIAPNIFKNAGPKCLNGSCPEGKMSCGKSKEIKEQFSALKEGVKYER